MPVHPQPATQADHGALMDSVYRGQRHIYDVTRKYYLFGRDRMIAGLGAAPGTSVIEIGCGTGRNLAIVRRRWRGAELYGIDISSEMLKSASSRLGGEVRLALGDAAAFDPAVLFGRPAFDRVLFSYVLSMIPDWRTALDQGAALLAPGGSLHVVDFGDFAGLPGPVSSTLRSWLLRFHVDPRSNLVHAGRDAAERLGLTLSIVRGPCGYYRMLTLSRATD